MKIVRHHANGRSDWLLSGHQNVNPLREAISILSSKYKRFTFVHPEPLNPGLHIVVLIVSTVANMFLTLFQTVLIQVNTLITTSQA